MRASLLHAACSSGSTDTRVMRKTVNRLVAKPGCWELRFRHIFLLSKCYTINEAHEQYSLLDTISNNIFYFAPQGENIYKSRQPTTCRPAWTHIWPIFKQILEKYPSGGAPRALPTPWEGVFFKICMKMDHIWLILFSESPFGHSSKNSPFSRGRKLPRLCTKENIRPTRAATPFDPPSNKIQTVT